MAVKSFKFKKSSAVSKVLLFYLTNLTDILARRDISAVEKWQIVFWFFLSNFQRGNTLRFLDYVIHFSSRSNFVGILIEVFLKGNYAFKPNSYTPRIIDVGGNIGIATLFFKRYFPTSHVIIFEAGIKNFQLLKKNIESNHLENITAIFGIVGKDVGVKDFYYNAKSPGCSTSVANVAQSKALNNFTVEKVPEIQLSTYITQEIDLLKMDVEGAEGEILEELEESGKIAFIQQMIIEYHANEANKNNELPILLERLKRNGFSLVIYDNERGAFGRKMENVPKYHFMIRAYRELKNKPTAKEKAK